MKHEDQAIKRYAKQLTKLSIEEDGFVSLERVRAVLHVLKNKPPRPYRKTLLHYRDCIEAELKKTQALIEHAGNISESTCQKIRDSLSKNIGRTVQSQNKENPALIAGVRVSLADNVWELSVINRLQNLA